MQQLAASREADPGETSDVPLHGFGLRHLWLLVPFVWIAWVVGRPVGDNSFLWHVRAGTAQLEAGRVFTTDPFSFTAGGEPWRTQSWLAELGYGWLENLTGGIGWVHVMLMVVTGLTLAAAGLAAHRSTGSLGATAAVLFVVAWQLTWFAVPRPVVFGYLGLALVVVALRRDDADLWVVPLLIWAWAAVHGSFVLGLGLVVLDAAARRSRRRAAAAGVAVVLASLTAHGIGVWQILVDFLGARGALDLISEWDSPDYTNPFVLPYALVLGAILVAAVKGKIARSSLIVILPFAFFGMLANRNLVPATLVLAPYAAAVLSGRPGTVRRRGESTVMNLILAGAMVAFAFMGFNRPVTLNENRFPEPAVLDIVGEGPVFHGTAMGGYLIYAAWPDRLVYIDDRAELFGEERFREFHDVRNGIHDDGGAHGYRAVFAEHGIGHAILETEWPLVGALAADGWQELHRDEHFVILRAP
jgi:hypothetical protein